MSHFALLWKARTIEKHRQNYENEKHNSIIMSNADVPNKTLLQRWKHYSHDVQKRLSRTFSKWYPEGTTMSNFLVNFRAEMMFPHILLRSLFGFVGGLVLTYLCFVFLVFQLFLPLIHATVLSSLFGVLITLGLTFSNRMRCLVFLLIPQLFSRAGRYTLTCYALVLILTGPATNTLKNSEVLSESMACSQENIKISVRDINQSLIKPYNSIQDSIKLMVEQLKRITLILRTAILRINRLILSIASLIQTNFSWLETIAESCNNQLGSPYQRCLASLKKSVVDCKACSKDAGWYYSAVSVATVACGVLKPYEKFCVPSDFAGETFYATVRRKLKLFTNRISEAIFLKIRTRHSYTFVGNTSSPSQVAAGIVTEIRNRADPILTWLSWSSCVTSLFLLLIIFRAKYYQHMYETRSRFDNRYITKEFRELDLRRLREGRETVLPLNRRERAKYVTTTSFRLVASEKIYLNRSAVFMTITSFKLLIHIVADYSLYWVLMTIRHHGQLQSPVKPGLPTTGAHITGTGFVSRLLQALFDTMNIPLLSAPSSTSCLPKPHPPDFKRYSQIGTLIVLLWIFSLFEPYGLRLRHLIMGHYKPERAKTRAAWLYNHILRTRGSFMKFARRKLHREYKYRSENKLTFRNWLRSLIPFHWLQCLLGVQLQEAHCLLCNTVQDDHDVNTKLTRCQDPNCPGTFCNSCFSDIGQMCTICMSPKDYGDLSDVSLEKGSSDEDDDNNDENGGSKPNNGNDINERIDLDENSNDDGNFDTKYESDNQSEYSENRRDIFYEIAPLIQHYKEVTNEKKYDMLRTLDRKIFTATKKYFYSFYRVNIQETGLLVTKHGQTSRLANCLRKKVSHCQNKYKNISRIKKYIVTCKNNKKEGSKKVKKENKKNKDPDEKKGKNIKKNCDKKSNNIKKDIETKKPKKHQKDDNKPKVTDKTPCVYSFQAKCSKYWKNFSIALSCTDIGCTNKCLPIMKEKKHNRKKKPKKCKDPSSKHHKKENNEDARKYRISTYLADQDWKKKDTIDDKIDDASSLVQTTKNFEENEIEVNHIRIPRLNLRFSSESLNNNFEGDKIRMRNNQSKKENYFKRKHFKFNALDKIVKRLSFSSITINSEDDSKYLKIEEVPRQLNLCNSELNMPRSMKYFRSLGHDFVQRHTHELLTASSVRKDMLDFSYPKVPSKTSNAGSENSHVIKETIFNENIKSVEKMNPEDDLEETKTKEPINLKKSSDGPAKNSSDTKRQSSEKMGFGLKTPLVKVIKDFCNSLFSTSEKRLNSKPENPNTTADKEIGANPCMQSCGCQKTPSQKEQKDNCVQVEQKQKSDKKKSSRFFKNVVHKDAHVNAVNSTCTCATQHYTNSRDVGTLKTQTGYHFNSELTIEDILSPSRYLLESQKYYNELYASKLYSPHVFPVARLYQYQKFEPRSPMSMSSHHHTRRGRRTKRLEDCYMRKQQTPLKKRMEYSKPPDSTRQVRQKRST